MSTLGISGRYKFVITNSVSNEVREIPWFDNLITDLGLEQLGVNAFPIITEVALGNGSAVPNVLDTSLGSYVNKQRYSSVIGGTQSTAPYFGWNRFSFNFPLDSVTGNINEVGVMLNGQTETELFSRSLIKENGVPITITVLPTDYVTVIYEIRIYPPLTDTVANINIGSTNYQFTIRAANVTSGYWGTSSFFQLTGLSTSVSSSAAMYVYDSLTELGDITASLSSTNAPVNFNTTLLPYEAQSKRVRVTFAIPVDQANFTDGLIGGILIGYGYGYGAFQMKVVPPLPKDNTKTLSLTFAYSWARYTV